MPDGLIFRDAHALIKLAEHLRASGYRFVTPTPATHARINARPGSDWSVDLRDVFGWSRRFRPDILPPGLFDAMQSAKIVIPDHDGWRSTVRFSTLGEDLFLHSAYPTTAADAVFFGPDTYRFCAAVRADLADAPTVTRAVDLCSGAGPGAVTVGRLYPDAEILMADINQSALEASRVNAALANLPNLHPIRSNLLHDIDGDFDLIIANPPYLNDPLQRAYRHGGGSHGCNLSIAILAASLPRLRPGGRLVLYTGVAILDGADPFRAAAAAHLAGWSWRYREIDPDVFGEELEEPAYADADRIAAVALTATKSGKSPCPME